MGANNYIVVKDRNPYISEVKNDCTSLCGGVSGESLSSILSKMCGRITNQNFIFNDTPTIHFTKTNTTITADVQISGDDNNCLTQGEDGGLFVDCAAIQGVFIEAGNNISVVGNGSEADPYIIGASNSGGWWTTLGNASTSPSTNFIGTTDAQGIAFRVNNVFAGFISNRPTTDSIVANHGELYIGKFAGQYLGTTATSANILIGPNAGRYIGANFANLPSPVTSGANTMIGNWAGHFTQYADIYGYGRNVFVGYSSAFNNISGGENATLGAFSLELNNSGTGNVAVGRDAIRSNIDGFFNVGVGTLALVTNTTGIASITVTNGGSGYTTATVTISAPYHINPTGACGTTATATATIEAGVITAITVTNPGCGYSSAGGTLYTGYSHPAVTVTITGDGNGATATANLQSGTGNTAVGQGAGLYNRLGQYNSYFGYAAGQSSRYYDTYNLFLGFGSDITSSVPATTIITNATAIGKYAKVGQSNSIVLGATGADAVNVGINTETPRKKLDIVGGDILVHEITIGRGKGSVSTNTIVGYNSMVNSTTGQYNTGVGYEALASITSSTYNTAIGYQALKYRSTGAAYNTVVGASAYSVNAGGFYNTILGAKSFENGQTAEEVIIGWAAGFSYTTGTYGNDFGFNVAVGCRSMAQATTTANNTFVGWASGHGVTTGSGNIGVGLGSIGRGNFVYGGTPGTTGSNNVMLGIISGYSLTNGASNIGIGTSALYGTTSGNSNIAIGYDSGSDITTGSNNVIIGGNTGSSIAALSGYILMCDGAGTERMRFNSSGQMIIATVPEYADNAAATGAGLSIGTVYRTGDNLKIVH